MTETELKLAREIAAKALADLDAKIDSQKKSAHDANVAKVRELMAELGMTDADLAGRMPRSPAALKSVRAKVEPKYRNSAGLTWSGRGARPNWLRKALDSGFNLDEFKIAA